MYTTSAVALLDEPAEVHHRDAVAHVADDRQVVRDEEVRDAELALQRASRLITWAWVDTSSELTGSSHTTRPGLIASARAIARRCS